jgi:hypothetical protein
VRLRFAWLIGASGALFLACSTSDSRPPLSVGGGSPAESPCVRAGGTCLPVDAKTTRCPEGFFTSAGSASCAMTEGVLCCVRLDAGAKDAAIGGGDGAPPDASNDAPSEAPDDAADDVAADVFAD